MSTATLKVAGFDAIRNGLLQLPDRLATNSLASAVNAGAAVIRDAARDKAPLYTGDVSQGHPPPGTLRRSIIVKAIRELSTYYSKTAFVTVRRGKKYAKQGKKGNLSQDAFYWRWVEFGHYYAPREAGSRKATMRAVRAGGRMVAGSFFVAAQPFMRPAYDAKKSAAVDAIKQRLLERIQQHAAEMKK